MDCIIKYTNATPFKGFLRIGYSCHFCKEEYERPSDLKSHTLKKHLTESVMQVTVLADTNVKLDITGLKCKFCDENIDKLESVLLHLSEVHNERIHTKTANYLIPFKFDSEVLKCVVCADEFQSFKLLNDHINLNHYTNYACSKCGRGFINKRSLITHSYRHETGTFSCQYCPKVFSNRVCKIAHERSVHLFNSKRHKCGYCGERFTDVVKKKDHEVKIHNAPKPIYTCQACNKTYKSQRSLRTHIRGFHLLLRPYKCAQCEFSASKNIELKMHMVKHTGSKNFCCVVCSKSYGRKSTLREHMRIHVNDKRFKCEHCMHAFVQKCSWKTHMRTKHGKSL